MKLNRNYGKFLSCDLSQVVLPALSANELTTQVPVAFIIKDHVNVLWGCFSIFVFEDKGFIEGSFQAPKPFIVMIIIQNFSWHSCWDICNLEPHLAQESIIIVVLEGCADKISVLKSDQSLSLNWKEG